MMIISGAAELFALEPLDLQQLIISFEALYLPLFVLLTCKLVLCILHQRMYYIVFQQHTNFPPAL